MAHNDHAGGSGGSGYYRPMNFNADEAAVLWENNILVPLAWHLPHEWHISAAGTPSLHFQRATCSTTLSTIAGS
jgi:hypothetical protein